jgi:PcfJ-like protein
MSKKISKTAEESMRKKAYDEQLHKILCFSKKRFKRFGEVIEHLYLAKPLEEFAQVDERMRSVASCFDKLTGHKKKTERFKFKEMLLQLDGCSDLLKEGRLIEAVYNIFNFRACWIKDMGTWEPQSKLGVTQLEELATHLFCHYPVPKFMYQSLFEEGCKTYIKWLIHLGIGGKVKSMPNIPIPFTQKMGHYFLQAPNTLGIREALRWAQVKGLGGSTVLADKIAYSWLAAKPVGQEDFWLHFLQLLVQDDMLNPDKAGELIDYVREAKRTESGYSLKGRTIYSLLRQSDRWHQQFGRINGNQVWKPCGIGGWKVEKKSNSKKEITLLEELTEQKLLIEEGKTMKHCVASYSFYCTKGKTAIFSMRKYWDGLLLDTLATIEVNLSLQRVVQAKGKMNRAISDEAKRMMLEWADARQIEVNPYL